MNPFKIPLTFIVLLVVLSSNSTSQDNPWQNIGPWMGYIHGMALDDSHPDTVYAATQYGLFKSVDGAENWIPSGFSKMEILSIKVSPSSPNIILCSSEYQVYKSVDYGVTWDTIFSDTIGIKCITFNPYNSMGILIGSDAQNKIDGWEFDSQTNGLMKSTNGGETWFKMPFTGVGNTDWPEQVKYIIIDPSDTTKLYVGTYNRNDGGLFISHDNGLNWDVKRIEGSSERIMALACTPADYENHTIFAILGGGLDRKFFISQDSGLNWTEISVPSSAVLGRNTRDNAICISPDAPEKVYIGADYNYEEDHASIVMYNLSDEGWYYRPDSPISNPTSLLITKGADFLGFRYHGVYRYDGSETGWILKGKGLNSGEVYDFAVNPKDPDKILTAIRSNVARTSDGGDTWNLAQNNFSALAISKKDTSFTLAGSRSTYYLTYGSPFYYYESDNSGMDWTSQLLFTRMGSFDYDYKFWTGDILIFPNDPDKYIFGIDGGGGAGEGIYITEDGGSSWLVNYGTGVSTLAQDPNDENILYLGTTNLGYVRRSTEGGKNWEAISPGGQDAFAVSVLDLGIDKNSKVFAATSSGLFTWDGETSWSLVPGLPEINTTAIAIDNFQESPVYYVGTEEQGIFVSGDGGLTWENFNAGIGTLDITRLKINDSYPRNLYAGTKDEGVWKTTLQENATFVPAPHKPEITIGIFPNPNNGTFRITTNAGSELKCEMKVINLLGKVIYADDCFIVYPGSVQVVGIDNVASGNYILVFTNDKFTINKKIIITRTK
jgi:photosystem II stability/assembly factor-like uncharacterized protein